MNYYTFFFIKRFGICGIIVFLTEMPDIQILSILGLNVLSFFYIGYLKPFPDLKLHVFYVLYELMQTTFMTLLWSFRGAGDENKLVLGTTMINCVVLVSAFALLMNIMIACYHIV